MILHAPGVFVLRAQHKTFWIFVALVVLTTWGCGHNRQAMRPAYVVPGSAPCPTCPSGAASAVVAPSSEVAPATIDPALEPASEATVPRLEAPTAVSEPAPTATPEPMTPPRPTPAGEPELYPAPGASGIPKASPGPPPVNGPAVSPSSPGTSYRSNSTRVRQTSLRERVAPFVNDPGDLFVPPKADRPWKYIVLHHSANPEGSYDQIDREHRKVLGWEGCGYHFIIGNGTGSPDGQIEVAKRWSDQRHGVHSRNGKHPDVNEYGIGICLVGDLDEAPPTPRQIAAAKALIAYLGTRYGVPADRIGTHADLAASPTACPGKYFPIRTVLGSRNVAYRSSSYDR
jgi:hypothetical protein